MKQTAYALCMFCLAACVVQSLLPQGKTKRMAVFACSVLFVAIFLEQGMTLFQSLELPSLRKYAQSNYAQTAMAPNEIYAQQIVRNILGETVSCDVLHDESGNIRIEINGGSAVSYAGKQSIKQVLCGIYDIEEGAIQFVQGR